MSYTVRFDRDNRGWTCSVFSLDGNGAKSGASLATGTGVTQDAAKTAALTATSDAAVRAALTAADPARPYWLQGGLQERHEAAMRAAVPPRSRTDRLRAHRKERGGQA